MEHAVALYTKAERPDRWQRLVRHWAEALFPLTLPLLQDACHPLLCPADGGVVCACRQPIVPSCLPRSQRHHRHHPGASDSTVFPIEDHVRAASLRRELRPHAPGWHHGAATETGGLGTRHGAAMHFPIRSRLEHVVLDTRRRSWGVLDPRAQRPLALWLCTQPERGHQRYLCPAVRRFAAHGSRPQVGHRGSRHRNRGGVQVGQFPLGFPFDLTADLAQLLGQSGPVARDVLQHHLEDQTRHGVEVAGERLATEPQCLQRDRASTGKGVHDQGRLPAMHRLHEGTLTSI